MTQQQDESKFVEELIDAAIELAGIQPSATWRQVAKHRIGGKTVSVGDYTNATLWCGPKRIIDALTKEASILAVQVNQRYWDLPYEPATATALTGEDQADYARQFLPTFGNPRARGFHVADDSTDPLYTEWRKANMRKFGGGIASQAGQMLDAALDDGNGAGATDVLLEGYEAATPKAKIGDRIVAELGTTPTKLLGKTQK